MKKRTAFRFEESKSKPIDKYAYITLPYAEKGTVLGLLMRAQESNIGLSVEL